MKVKSYGAQHGRHELVGFLWLDEASHLQDACCETGYDGRVLGQRLLEHLAILVIVLQRAYFGYATKALKGAQVGFVDMGKMGIGDDDVGQGLDIAKTMGEPAESQQDVLAGRAPWYDLVGSSNLQ